MAADAAFPDVTAPPIAAPPIAAVVLGAGRGTRMNSARPKVMQKVAGRPMVLHVLDAVRRLRPERELVIVGPDMDDVAAAVAPATVAVQPVPRGTADAVKSALPALAGFGAAPASDADAADVLVVFGDAATIQAETLAALVAARRRAGAALAVLGIHVAGPNRYGRLIKAADGSLERIVEFHDASAAQKALTLCNSGMMTIAAHRLKGFLAAIGNHNAKGEFYIGDAVALARQQGLATAVLESSDPDNAVGADDRAGLARCEAVIQRRLRQRALAAGCSMPAPDTVHLSWDTAIGPDTTIEPYVVIGSGVAIGQGASVASFSHLEGCAIGARARIGPHARLRPGASVGEDARVGNFVEVKNARLERGVKVGHLSYIGDAEIGADANIGAGTITCNWDGAQKHTTRIGKAAFIGSNTALVAPVEVGGGAIIGAGSAVTRDVEADALMVERSPQVAHPGRAPILRRRKAARRDRQQG